MSVGTKIKIYIKEKGITIKQFAIDIDENRTLVSNYLNDKSKPSVKFLYKTISYFPEMDLNYLFRESSDLNEKPSIYGASPKKLIKEIEERLRELQRQLDGGIN